MDTTTTSERLEDRIRREIPHLPNAQVSELARIVERLIAALHPESIYVFGSQARGDARADSDVDLLMIVPRGDEPGYRLAQEAYAAAGPRSMSLDILVMPRDEFDWRSRALASLPATVLREGRVVYAA